MAETEYWFYHITHGTLEGVLPGLLEKTLEKGWSARVLCPDQARLTHLDDYLWTYRDDSFLPHGREDQPSADYAPIRLTVNGEGGEPAHLHLSIGGSELHPGPETARCIVIIDDNDPAGRDKARNIWSVLKESGKVVTYYQQGDGGKWVKR